MCLTGTYYLPTFRFASSSVNRDNGVRNDGISSIIHLKIGTSCIENNSSKK